MLIVLFAEVKKNLHMLYKELVDPILESVTLTDSATVWRGAEGGISPWPSGQMINRTIVTGLPTATQTEQCRCECGLSYQTPLNIVWAYSCATFVSSVQCLFQHWALFRFVAADFASNAWCISLFRIFVRPQVILWIQEGTHTYIHK